MHNGLTNIFVKTKRIINQKEILIMHGLRQMQLVDDI